MQIPNILAAATPPGGLIIPVTPGEGGGLGGTLIHAVHGPPVTLDASWDGEAWHPARLPWLCGGSGYLRLTREDGSNAASVLASVGGQPTPQSGFGAGGMGGPGQHVLAAPGTLTGVDMAADETLLFSLPLPLGAPYLRVGLAGGSGEAEVYVYREPQREGAGLDSLGAAGRGEYVVLDGAQAGRYVLEVYASSPASDMALEVLTTNPDGPTPPAVTALQSGVPVTGITVGEWGARYYAVEVPEGTESLTATVQTGGNAMLYLSPTARATMENDPGGPGHPRTVNAPQAGTWSLLLYTPSGLTDATLTATLT